MPSPRSPRPILAAGAAALLLGCGDLPPGGDAAAPFFPEVPALTATGLGVAHWQQGRAGLEILVDQGIPGVADVSDIFLDTAGGVIVVGGAAPVRARLEAALADAPAAARRAWREHADGFVFDADTAPTAEGILARRTPSLLVPRVPETEPAHRGLDPILRALVRVVETRSDVPLTRVETRGGPWLQDFLTAFDDGRLGIPPQLDSESFERAFAAVHERAPDFMLGGVALGMRPVIEVPLADLRSRGRRFRPMRAFVEGGNVVFAEHGDGRLRALVGENTLRLTASVYALDEARALALLAGDFLLAPDQVIAVPQPDYHLDLHLRAAGRGRVFLASQEAGLEMLERALLDPAVPQREALEALRRRARRAGESPVGEALRRNLAGVRSRLEAGGFEVIPYPSLYYSYFATSEYEKRDGLFAARDDARLYIHVNTMNGRYVTDSDGRVMSFVLSSGYEAIDRSLEALERRNGVDEVYFLGQSLAAPRFWGSQVLLSAAGVGCLTNL